MQLVTSSLLFWCSLEETWNPNSLIELLTDELLPATNLAGLNMKVSLNSSCYTRCLFSLCSTGTSLILPHYYLLLPHYYLILPHFSHTCLFLILLVKTTYKHASTLLARKAAFEQGIYGSTKPKAKSTMKAVPKL